MSKGKHLMFRFLSPYKDETNSVYLSNIEMGVFNRENFVNLKMVNDILSKMIYGILRNEHNFGYVASSYIKRQYEVK